MIESALKRCDKKNLQLSSVSILHAATLWMAFEKLRRAKSNTDLHASVNESQLGCTYVEHLVWRRLNSWNHVCWAECDLLNFCKIVLWVFVQCHPTNWNQWILALWPNLKGKTLLRKCKFQTGRQLVTVRPPETFAFEDQSSNCERFVE